MRKAKIILLQTPPPVNPNKKKSPALIVVKDIDSYTDFTPKQIKNFFKKVDKNGEVPKHMPHLGKCWNWTAGIYRGGYGCFSMFGQMRKPHRVSWLMHKGAIPKGEGFHGTCVLHKCDNRACVNPDHLFLGTHTDNMRDMEAKGRSDHPSGDRNGIRKHPEVLKRGKDHHWHKNAHLLTRGEDHHNSKLTEAAVIEIRLLKKKGGRFPRKILSEKYSVSEALIQKVAHGDVWKHIKV